MSEIDVSFVMTVYNKEQYLPSVLKALLNQSGLQNPEFIFCDDVSTDKSVEIIREMTKDVPNVKIFANTVNEGISKRINQGIRAATGKYTRMLDSDDIFPINSTETMIELAEKHNADMVYGTFVKTGEEAEELTDRYVAKDFEYKYHKDALRAVLCGRFTRMGQLIKTDVLQKADGADERVFIQDESIPIRAAKYADGIIKMQENVVLVPREDGNLSGNKIQLDHDRYLAYHYMILENQSLDKDVLAKMYKRAVSAYWKYYKKTHNKPTLSKMYLYYLYVSVFKPQPNIKFLSFAKSEFDKVENVLRSK